MVSLSRMAGFRDEIRSTLPAGVDLRSFFLVPSEPLAAGRPGAARSR